MIIPLPCHWLALLGQKFGGYCSIFPSVTEIKGRRCGMRDLCSFVSLLSERHDSSEPDGEVHDSRTNQPAAQKQLGKLARPVQISACVATGSITALAAATWAPPPCFCTARISHCPPLFCSATVSYKHMAPATAEQ